MSITSSSAQGVAAAKWHHTRVIVRVGVGLLSVSGGAACSLSAAQLAPADVFPVGRYDSSVFQTRELHALPRRLEAAPQPALSTNEALAALVRDPAVPMRALIARRLSQLVQMCREDDEPLPSGASIAGLHGFLRRVPGAVMPALSVTQDGELYARWRRDGDAIFSARFMGDQTFAFVLFAPSPVGGAFRRSGELTLDEALVALNFHAMPWVTDATTETRRDASVSIAASSAQEGIAEAEVEFA